MTIDRGKKLVDRSSKIFFGVSTDQTDRVHDSIRRLRKQKITVSVTQHAILQ